MRAQGTTQSIRQFHDTIECTTHVSAFKLEEATYKNLSQKISTSKGSRRHSSDL